MLEVGGWRQEVAGGRWLEACWRHAGGGRLEAGGWLEAGGRAGVAVGLAVAIRYCVSLPNRTETPQYWQYIYR